MRRKPEHIKEVLDVLMETAQGKEEQGLVVEKMWEETAGQKIIRHARPVALKKGVLYIDVDSSAWLFQLSMQKQALLKELKKRLGDEVKEIKFKVGPISQEK